MYKALISASSNNHIDIVKLLLDKGANIEAKDKVFPIFTSYIYINVVYILYFLCLCKCMYLIYMTINCIY